MTTDTKKADETRVKIGSEKYPVRFSYLNAHVAKDTDRIDKKTGAVIKMFSAQIIISKEDTESVAKIEKAVRAAADTQIPNKPIPKIWKTPMRDGDEEWEEKGEHLKGHWFLNCSGKKKPQVVGTEYDMDDKLVHLSEDEIKSGDYGRVTLNFYFFDVESKGIAAGMGNIQKLRDGESLGGSSKSADEDFDDDMTKGFSD